MDQIAQTENPMCSATIDQIKLRRATNLPLDSQNFSSSGFHSEIQVFEIEVGFSLIRNVLSQASVRALGNPPVGRSQNRMIGFQGRRRWRQTELFKLRAKPRGREMSILYNGLQRPCRKSSQRGFAFKICDSLISCAPHKK